MGNISDTTDAQLNVAVAHEMGHIFGLGHSSAESALMYSSLGRKENLSLSQDDIDGMTWLYNRVEPGDGFLGCGTLSAGSGNGGGGGLLWLLAAAGLLGLLFNFRPFAQVANCEPRARA